MNKRLFIKTYGCQMNEYDSARLADLLHEQFGMELTEQPENADLILLNTCSIREKAQEKVFSDLGRWKKIKKIKQELVIGVGGCVASQEGEKVLRRAPYVDFVFGPQALHKVPEMYHNAINKQRAMCDISFTAAEKFAALPTPIATNVSAFVTIMEGCNKYCSYCIVPFTRGKEVSRPFTDVLNECHCLAQQGVKELTFLGQNVNDYQGLSEHANKCTLADLITATAEINGIERIRFTTSYPSAFSQDLITAYANIGKLANHLHLPVQSGSNKVLKAMRRRYSCEEFKEKIYKLREVRPDISITSDFIVGFPGETENDFQQTMDLVKEIKFDSSFSFIFSPRPGTLAEKMTDDTPLAEKKQRLMLLQEELNQQAAKYSADMVGSTQKILVTGYGKKEQQLCGRTENNRIVNFIGAPNLIGELIYIRIEKALSNCLLGIM